LLQLATKFYTRGGVDFVPGDEALNQSPADWWGGQQRLFLIAGSAGCLRSLSLSMMSRTMDLFS
jgi:hypothetical protein